jgi:hypothetical protein
VRHYAVMGGHYAVMAVRCGGALRSNGRCGAAVDYAVMAVDYAVMAVDYAVMGGGLRSNGGGRNGVYSIHF